MKTARQRVRMDFDQNMGALYPFSRRRKLAVITEPSWLYDPETARESRWGRAVVPFEMLSVLFQYSSRDDGSHVRGPAVGLFADQEIRLVEGPLFVAEDYELEREVVDDPAVVHGDGRIDSGRFGAPAAAPESGPRRLR